MKKKLCFVIQRYGNEIIGGAESYCKTYAEKLSEIYDIEVATTTSLEYINWEDHYPEGTEIINGIPVHRFKLDKPFNRNSYEEIASLVFDNPRHVLWQANLWLEEQGPLSTGLINFIKENKDRYDLFLFFTYLYHPTAAGLLEVADKAILVPFAHDEKPIYFKCFDALFNSPKGIVFNTDEEMEFVHRHFKNENIPHILTGIGIEPSKPENLPDMRGHFGLKKPYMLYMGRIDTAKGCDELFEFFLEYKERYDGELQLVLTGKEVIPVPEHEDIISLGFVSEEEKYSVLKDCELFVLPSHFESLSIVVLDAFAFGKPVLVSGHCPVLKGHCEKSNGGLYFYSAEDFCLCLDFLHKNPALREAMGKNGAEYVDKHYRWDVIIEKITRFIDDIMQV